MKRPLFADNKKNYRKIKAAGAALLAAFMTVLPAVCLCTTGCQRAHCYKRAIYIYLCGSNLENNNGAAAENIKAMLNANFSGDTAVEVPLITGEAYEISGESLLDAALNCTSVSSDNSAAELRQGKYICGINPGKARIEVTKDGKATKYDVTVAPNAEQTGASGDLEENDIGIGQGFNLLDGVECTQENMPENEMPDWQRLFKDGVMRCDSSKSVEYKSYSGATFSFIRSFPNSV